MTALTFLPITMLSDNISWPTSVLHWVLLLKDWRQIDSPVFLQCNSQCIWNKLFPFPCFYRYDSLALTRECFLGRRKLTYDQVKDDNLDMFILHITWENDYNRSGLTMESHFTLFSWVWPTFSAEGQAWWIWNLGCAAEVCNDSLRKHLGKWTTHILVFPWDFPRGGPTAFTRPPYLLFLFSDTIFIIKTGCSPWWSMLIPEYSSLPSLLPSMCNSLHQRAGFIPVPEVTENPLHFSIIPKLKPHSSSFMRLLQMVISSLSCVWGVQKQSCLLLIPFEHIADLSGCSWLGATLTPPPLLSDIVSFSCPVKREASA